MLWLQPVVVKLSMQICIDIGKYQWSGNPANQVTCKVGRENIPDLQKA